ncbi:MAG: TIGR03663 family protein [Chloroflexaceae bacterium]|nr:TIGR03663 family protein [Chloroflexaceae bacterium]
MTSTPSELPRPAVTETTSELPRPESVVEPPVRPDPTGGVRRAAPSIMGLTLEHAAYLLLAVLSGVLHVWALGDRALHHDETLHAWYSWQLYQGHGHIHDPLLHGPFLYYVGALVYWLFGDNDTTARLGAALFGTVLPLLPFFVRRELGRPAALMAAVYLLISPTFLYVGRFIRHDIYSIVFEMLIFIAIVRYSSTHQRRWLYLGAAAFGFMITNQETSYLFVLMLVTPLLLLFLWRVCKPGIPLLFLLGLALAMLFFVLPGTATVDGEHRALRDAEGMMEYTPGPLFGWYPLETDDNTYALEIRNRADNHNNQSLYENLVTYLADLWRFFGHPAPLIAAALLITTMIILIVLIWLIPDGNGQTAWQRAIERGGSVIQGYASLAQDWRWLGALVIFFAIYFFLFTGFLSNMLGTITGTTGSLLYWLAQHNVERGGQPPHYYLVLLTVYEPLIVFWAGLGMFFLVIGPVLALLQWMQRPPLIAYLLGWWSLTALGLYSWAGEKMPWLTVHILLPLVLLAAWSAQQVFRHLRGRGRSAETGETHVTWYPWRLVIFGGMFLSATALGFISLTTYIRLGQPLRLAEVQVPWGTIPAMDIPLAVIPLTLLLMLVLLTIAAGMTWGWRWSLSALLLCMTLMGSVYTIRNTYRLNYVSGDVPREMLIYTQTSPDVMRMVRYVEALSMRQTSGMDMPILYDNETVWSWYLRNFTSGTRISGQIQRPPDPEIQVAFLLRENIAGAIDENPALRGFEVHRFPLRWWFPEAQTYGIHSASDLNQGTVQPSILDRLLREPLADQTIIDVWNFLIHRDPGAPLGSSDFVIAVRPSLVHQLGPGFGAGED